MKRTILALFVLVVPVAILSIALAGCPPDDPPADTWEPDSMTYDVELAPDTVFVDEAHAGLLLDIDEENQIYTFDEAGAAAAGLVFAVGKPLMIAGEAVRGITSVTTVGGQIVVETEYIPLNEAIRNGTIAWDYGVEFTP